MEKAGKKEEGKAGQGCCDECSCYFRYGSFGRFDSYTVDNDDYDNDDGWCSGFLCETY